MRSSVTFPPPFPSLKLSRTAEKWEATLAEERRRLEEDHDILRERESNLREYEARLRDWQANIDAGRNSDQPEPLTSIRAKSPQPAEDNSALQSEWDKLNRAREIIKAEQAHMRDDRIVLRDQMETVKRRDQALTEREARLAEREAILIAALAPKETPAPTSEAAMATMTRLTLAPFEMARSVFGGKK